MEPEFSVANYEVVSAADSAEPDDPQSNLMAVEDTSERDSESELFLRNMRRLPDELLVMIFEMLPPTTLIMMANSLPWVQRAVHCVRVASFKECPFITIQELKLFIKPVSPCLMELYLDNLVSVKSAELCQLVRQCKHLKVLSLMNSGVLIQHVYNALEQLSLLVFRFTIVNPCHGHPLKHVRWGSNLSLQKLKKLHLEVGDITMFHHFIRYLLPFCHELTELILNFSVHHRYLASSEQIWGENNQLKLPYLDALIITWPMGYPVMMENSEEWKVMHLTRLLEWLFSHRTAEIRWKKFWVCDSLLTDRLRALCKVEPENLSSATCLFITETDDTYDMSMLQKFLPNSIRQIGLDATKLNQSRVDHIKHACGSGLKQLAVITKAWGCILMAIKPFDLLLKSCANITDLDISGIHVTDRDGTSFCAVICALKELKRLCLPICAITDIPVHVAPTYLSEETSAFAPPRARKRACHHITLNHNAAGIFSRMVKSCSLVEDFHLTGCFRCGQSETGNVFCENIISDIYMWKRLKHLRINNVPSLRLITFVDAIADHCEDFMSLQLANIGHAQVFHFMPSILKVLRYSKKFTFLRIVHQSFHWDDSSFWGAVACASNLQGLCIASGAADHVSTNMVIMSLMKLSHFHIFHLHCKLASEKQSLHQKLKTMLGNTTNRPSGINNSNLIIANSEEHSYGSICEPHCDLFHFGIRDTSTKAPCFS